MGILKQGTVDSSEPTDAQAEDADLLELGDVPEVLFCQRGQCENVFIEDGCQ